MEIVQLTPNASSLIESLRDIGYTFETAVADIIDNSITANAKNIEIFFQIQNNNSLLLAILDDGYGMTQDDLISAMRPGSTNPLDTREEGDLGRFGLGLKTASFSQCRKLTVASKTKNNDFNATMWDLDFVAIHNDWSLKILNQNDIKELFKINKLKNSGTLIIWEETDRIIDTTEEIIDTILVNEKINLLQKHLELVFHRFLEGQNKIIISINGMQIIPFDPFFKKHMATQELQEEHIIVNNEDIVVKPYILPNYSKVSAKDYEYYAGEGGYIKNQGFYVYRNKRLLISGTWFRIITQSESSKLARIQIDLPNSLDDLWKIDVKKSMAFPPSIIRNRLKNIIDKISSASSNVSRQKAHKSQSIKNSFWIRESSNSKVNYSINKDHPMIKKFISTLNSDQTDYFNKLTAYFGDYFPKDILYSDLTNHNPNMINQNSLDDDKLELMALDEINQQNGLLTHNEFKHYFDSTEPFNTYSKNWDEYLTLQGIIDEQ